VTFTFKAQGVEVYRGSYDEPAKILCGNDVK